MKTLICELSHGLHHKPLRHDEPIPPHDELITYKCSKCDRTWQDTDIETNIWALLVIPVGVLVLVILAISDFV